MLNLKKICYKFYKFVIAKKIGKKYDKVKRKNEIKKWSKSENRLKCKN